MLGSLFNDDQIAVFLRNSLVFLSDAEELAHEEDDSCPNESAVEGVVKIRLTKPSRLSFVSVKLAADVTGLSEDYSSYRRTIWHRTLESPVEEFLPAGEHVFAFSVFLPAKAPTSIITRHGSVKWRVTAEMKLHPGRKKTAMTPLQVVHKPANLFDSLSHVVGSVAGFADALGPYRFSFEIDTHVGGAYSLNLSLPSSSTGIELYSIYARIEQTVTCDKAHSRDAEEHNDTTQLYLCHHTPSSFVGASWPEPGPSGSSFSTSGRLPGCKSSLNGSLQPSTPDSCQTPLRISHELIVGLEFRAEPSGPRLRLQGSRSIRLTSCELEAESHLPKYCAEAPLERTRSVSGCACTRDILAPAAADVQQLRVKCT